MRLARSPRGSEIAPHDPMEQAFHRLAGVQLKDVDHLVLVDAKAPVSFFAYPDKKSYLVPDTCAVHELSPPAQDARASLDKLVQALGAAQAQPALQAPQRPDRPRGALTAPKVCKAVGHLLPENAILIDEAITSGLMLNVMTAGGPRHDLITLTGGAIGQGLPSAFGASVAVPASLPAGNSTFSRSNAAAMSSGVRPCAASRAGSIHRRMAYFFSPHICIVLTPGMVCNRSRITFDA